MAQSIRQSSAALNASIDASRTDQRAWVNVQSEGAIVNEDGPIDIPVIVSNRGKTPALRLEGDIIATVMLRGEGLDTSYKPGHLRNHTVGGTLLPGTEPPTDFRAMRMLGQDTANIASSPSLSIALTTGTR
jgi:hypothetical protein